MFADLLARSFTGLPPSLPQVDLEGSRQGFVSGSLMSPRHMVFLILLTQTSAFFKNAAKSCVCHRSEPPTPSVCSSRYPASLRRSRLTWPCSVRNCSPSNPSDTLHCFF